jgi:hypothetical protein
MIFAAFKSFSQTANEVAKLRQRTQFVGDIPLVALEDFPARI